ncbi:MAG: patatin-like phospholipase family protein [Nitrososphaeraceae archaeon]
MLLEGSCNLDQNQNEPNEDIRYDWNLVLEKSDKPQLLLRFENTRTVTFVAPYVSFDPGRSDNKTYSCLVFKVVATDKGTNLKSEPSFVTVIVKMIHRALVLQGGGSLGAYEVGVYKALCEQLTEQDKNNNVRHNRPLFDIVAGTSIGAVNAALIVHSIKQGNISKDNDDKNLEGIPEDVWKKSVRELERFWDEITFPISVFENQAFQMWWNLLHYNTSNFHEMLRYYDETFKKYSCLPSIVDPEFNLWNPFYLFTRQDMYTPSADAETARRYFSWLYFPYLFPNRIITPNFLQPDTKFFTHIPQFARFDNSFLAKAIKEKGFWDSEKDPIKTNFQNGEPRLLVVAVDVLDATSPVTFDSYMCCSRYKDGRNSSIHPTDDGGDGKIESEHIIQYQDGITIKHISASMSPHNVIEYPSLEDEQGKGNTKRYFWDGAYLSNTPLRELLHLHRYYWYSIHNGEDNKNNNELNRSADQNENSTSAIATHADALDKELYVPHLEVYIVNLYPAVDQEQNTPPQDPDRIQDRELEIRFHDKTTYDVKVAEMITDYLILHGQMKNLAEKYIGVYDENQKMQEFQREYQNLLNGLTHSQERKNNSRYVDGSKHQGDITALRKNQRTYRDLIEGRFDIAKILYINRKEDKNTIFGKAADFSRETMIKSKTQGYRDTYDAFALNGMASESYRILNS